MDFLNHREGGYGFLSGFHPFPFAVFSNSTVETVRGCVHSLKKNVKRLREFEENEISRQSCTYM